MALLRGIMRHLNKLTKETKDSWFKVLPRTLMRAQIAPKKKGLSPFECLQSRPLLCTDIALDAKALELTM